MKLSNLRLVRSRNQIPRLLRKRDTWAEKLLWGWLRNRKFSSYKFRRQHRFGEHVLDFFCVEARVNIELDGAQHGFPEQRKLDAERDAWLEKAGVRVLRYWNGDLRRNQDGIRDTIWRTLQERTPHPLPDYCRPLMERDEREAGRGCESGSGVD